MNDKAPKGEATGDTIDVDANLQGQGRNGQGQGQQQGQGQGQGEGEGQDEGEGDAEGDGDGQHQQNQDSDDEGIDQQTDGDSEGDTDGESDDSEDSDESEGEEESEQNDRNDEQEHGECDGNCKPPEDDDEDSEPCPYCNEKQKRQQQRQQNPVPIALDAWKNPIFVGDEVESCGDGSHQDEYDRYTGVVMGIAYGRADEPVEERMIVVKRRDGVSGGYEVEGESDGHGWGVRSHLCTVEQDEQEKEKQEHKHKEEIPPELQELLDQLLNQQHDHDPQEEDEPEDSGEEFDEQFDDEPEDEPEEDQQEEREDEHPVICLDVDGHPLKDGDRVQIVKPGGGGSVWPNGFGGLHEDAVATLRDDCHPYSKNNPRRTYPGIVGDDALAPKLPGDWVCPVTGRQSYTFAGRNGERVPWLRYVSSPDDEPESDEKKSLPLTKQQEERFQNLFERIANKTRDTFGATLERSQSSPDLPGGVYDGEAVAKYIEIESRGVTYRVILTASRWDK